MRRYVFYFLILTFLYLAAYSENKLIDKNASLIFIYILILNIISIFLIIIGYSGSNVRIFSNDDGLFRVITNGYLIVYSLIIYAYLEKKYYLLNLALLPLILTFSRTGCVILSVFLILIFLNDKRINKYSISITIAIIILIFFRSGLFEKFKNHIINYSTPSISLYGNTNSTNNSVNDKTLGDKSVNSVNDKTLGDKSVNSVNDKTLGDKSVNSVNDKTLGDKSVNSILKFFGERYSEPMNAIINYSLYDFVFGVGFGKKINNDTKIQNLTSKYDIHNSYISGLLYVGLTFIFFIWLLFSLIKKNFFINKKFTLFVLPVIIFESFSSQAIYFSSEGLIFFISYILFSNLRVNYSESI